METTKFSRSLLKNLLVVSLALVFLWQAVQAWKKHAQGDTLVVSQLRQPKEQTFPSVTLCRYIETDDEEAAAEAVERNEKLENWISYVRLDGENQTFQPDATSNWQLRPMSPFITAPTGPTTVCHTFSPPREIVPGMAHAAEFDIIPSLPDESTFIALHQEFQNIPTAGDLFGNAFFFLKDPPEGLSGRIDLSIHTTLTERLATAKVPCSTTQEFKLMDCLEGFFQKQWKCTLPWNSDSPNKTSTCSNGSGLDDFEDFMNDIIERPSYEDIYNDTRCSPPCKQQFFSYQVPQEITFATDGEPRRLELVIYLTPNGIKHEKEVLVFDTLEMIGNVGGYLGLLLGWSVMSAVGGIFDRKSILIKNFTSGKSNKKETMWGNQVLPQ